MAIARTTDKEDNTVFDSCSLKDEDFAKDFERKQFCTKLNVGQGETSGGIFVPCSFFYSENRVMC